MADPIANAKAHAALYEKRIADYASRLEYMQRNLDEARRELEGIKTFLQLHDKYTSEIETEASVPETNT